MNQLAFQLKATKRLYLHILTESSRSPCEKAQMMDTKTTGRFLGMKNEAVYLRLRRVFSRCTSRASAAAAGPLEKVFTG